MQPFRLQSYSLVHICTLAECGGIFFSLVLICMSICLPVQSSILKLNECLVVKYMSNYLPAYSPGVTATTYGPSSLRVITEKYFPDPLTICLLQEQWPSSGRVYQFNKFLVLYANDNMPFS